MASTDNHLCFRFQWQSSVRDQHGHVVIHLDVHATVSAAASSSTASPCNNLAFIVPVLITFVQIKFPEANDKCCSVFESHQATTMAAIASLLVYWLSLEAMQTFPSYALKPSTSSDVFGFALDCFSARASASRQLGAYAVLRVVLVVLGEPGGWVSPNDVWMGLPTSFGETSLHVMAVHPSQSTSPKDPKALAVDGHGYASRSVRKRKLWHM